MQCSKCDSDVPEQDLIFCCVCKKYLHFVCELINEKNFRKMSNDTRSKWKCIVCKSVAVAGKQQKQISSADGASAGDKAALSTVVEAGVAVSTQSAAAPSTFTSTSGRPTTTLSQADLQAIGQVVKQLIQSELPPDFKTDFAEFKKSIQFISEEFESFKNDLTSIKLENEKIKKDNEKLKSDNEKLKTDIADLQSYSRRDNIVVTGITETNNECVNEVFNMLSKTIGSELTARDISVAHRLPSKKKDSIKPIVIKFVRRQDKMSWMGHFRLASSQDNSGAGISAKNISAVLPETRVMAYEHLIPSTLELLNTTRTIAREKGYRFVWVRDGNILVKKDETSKNVLHIKSDVDLSKM